ncbi:hypothetical protein [Serratia ficaria]|uniref:hypothetical protein n=1 Tax=Serratia ficaria TaxID=61651 RepID=UPI0021C8BD43|nr:hypothetical protein [Serratia ficaria]
MKNKYLDFTWKFAFVLAWVVIAGVNAYFIHIDEPKFDSFSAWSAWRVGVLLIGMMLVVGVMVIEVARTMLVVTIWVFLASVALLLIEAFVKFEFVHHGFNYVSIASIIAFVLGVLISIRGDEY